MQGHKTVRIHDLYLRLASDVIMFFQSQSSFSAKPIRSSPESPVLRRFWRRRSESWSHEMTRKRTSITMSVLVHWEWQNRTMSLHKEFTWKKLYEMHFILVFNCKTVRSVVHHTVSNAVALHNLSMWYGSLVYLWTISVCCRGKRRRRKTSRYGNMEPSLFIYLPFLFSISVLSQEEYE